MALDVRVSGIPEGYHRLLAPRLLAPWVDALVARAPAAPGARVLDLACGAGLVGDAFAPRARVVGLDFWDEMVALARRLRPERAWVLADFHRIPLREASFDALACQQGLQFADEPAAVLREARRVLRPGGGAVFAVWTDLDASPGFAALRAEVARHWGEDAAPGVAMPFRLDDADALDAALREAGFADVRVERLTRTLRFASPADFLESYVAGSYLLDLLPAQPEEARRGLVAAMERALAPWTGPEGLAFPIHAHLASGRAP